MKDLRLTLLLALSAAILGTACSNQEKAVVTKYFGALSQNDNATLGSFATVSLDKKVDDWAITSVVDETKVPAPLGELIEKLKAAEARFTENQRAYKAYNMEHTLEVQQVVDLRKQKAAIPAKLQAVATQWDQFVEANHGRSRERDDAKAAVEREKKFLALSIGDDVQDVEKLMGDLITKRLDLTLTIAGKPEPYLMTLKRYELKTPAGQRVMSRWIVAALAPKA